MALDLDLDLETADTLASPAVTLRRQSSARAGSPIAGCRLDTMAAEQQQAELLRTSLEIAETASWCAYRQVPRGMGGMDRTSPEYRRWRRQAAGHAFLAAAVRIFGRRRVDPPEGYAHLPSY